MPRKYPALGLTAAVNDGAEVDMRFKLAVELAKTPGYWRVYAGGAPITAPHQTMPLIEGFADFCVELADCLYQAGEAAGWVEPLSTSSEITESDRAHLERGAAAQAHSQVHANAVGSALMQGRMRGMDGGIIS